MRRQEEFRNVRKKESKRTIYNALHKWWIESRRCTSGERLRRRHDLANTQPPNLASSSHFSARRAASPWPCTVVSLRMDFLRKKLERHSRSRGSAPMAVMCMGAEAERCDMNIEREERYYGRHSKAKVECKAILVASSSIQVAARVDLL